MKLSIVKNIMLSSALLFLFLGGLYVNAGSRGKCTPLVYEDVIKPECLFTTNSSNDTFFSLRLRLVDDFKGNLGIDKLAVMLRNLRVIAISVDTVIYLTPMLDSERRVCEFVSDQPMKRGEGFRILIPEGLLKIKPEFQEVDEIDVDESSLTSLSVAGAWHKAGDVWKKPAMFSVIDDDSLDGQIPSSKHSRYTYGYWSLLYPVLESLGIKGNLAVEGRKIGIDYNPPYLNDNGKTLVRLQDEKGWNLLCHSMECLGENKDNWIVDSLDTPLARKIFEEGPNHGLHARTVSVYDLSTGKQYWPDATNSYWEETPQRYIKPYAADYDTGRDLFYNPNYDIDWHWGEWKNRAEEFGIHAVGFVTHNSTSSHALVPAVREVFPNGLSDIGSININVSPMLSAGVRAGLEGQSLSGYDGNSTDNSFNEAHFKKFCAQVDETLEKGGWIIFNLHTYRDVWLNKLPGALVSEGGTYPDEWVIPMQGMDSANDPLSPPAHLGISDWSEWYPCPGTRLEMMWKILKYAQEKGLKNVTCSEGFEIMGNKTSVGYYNEGHRYGKDYFGLLDTDEVYPHYIVGATDEVSYYNPFTSVEYEIDIDEQGSIDVIFTDSKGHFLISEGKVMWSSPDPTGISLNVFDPSGRLIDSIPSNGMVLDRTHEGMLLICAVKSGSVLGSIKIAH